MKETEPFPLGAPESYIRVQTSYYKRCRQPTLLGDFTELWIPWSSETLRQDLPRKEVKKIRRFDGFCCVPSHLHFQEAVGSLSAALAAGGGPL